MIYQSYKISHPIHVSFPASQEKKNVDTEKLFKSHQIVISLIYNKMLPQNILKHIQQTIIHSDAIKSTWKQ